MRGLECGTDLRHEDRGGLHEGGAGLTAAKNRLITCLSVSQPFAELIVSGKKTVELRTWNTKFRGRFYVHAPLKLRRPDCIRLDKDASKLATGAIVGSANLSDVIRYESEEQLQKDSNRHFAGVLRGKNYYGFVLDGPKRLRVPIPYRGALGFFRAQIPGFENSVKTIKSEIIDEEFRYRWVGHH